MLKLLVILLFLASAAFALGPDDCERLLDDAKPVKVAKRRPFRWAEFAKQWHSSVELALFTSDPKPGERKALLSSYQEAVKRKDQRIASLEELALDFSEIGDGFVGVPPLGTVVQRFRAKLQAGIQAKKIPATSRLEPAVLVRNRAGDRIVLPYGEDRDDVYLVDITGRPADFTYLLTQNGFPISSNFRAIHELFHLRGLISDFDYMAGMHYLATEFMKPGGNLPLRDKYLRFFYAYEGLAYLPAEKLAALEPLLIVPLKEWPQVGRASQVYLRSNAEPVEKIIRDARALGEFCLAEITFLGGAGEIGVSYADLEIADTLPILLRNLRRSLTAYDLEKNNGTPAEKRERVRVVAIHRGRLEAAVMYSAEFDLKTWFRDLNTYAPPPKSALYRFAVESGVGTTGYPLPDGSLRGLFLMSIAGELNATHEPFFGTQFRNARQTKPPAVP